MNINGYTVGVLFWAVQSLIASTVGVVGWNVMREVGRTDRNQTEIQMLKQESSANAVRFDTIAKRMDELQLDVKRLLERRLKE